MLFARVHCRRDARRWIGALVAVGLTAACGGHSGNGGSRESGGAAGDGTSTGGSSLSTGGKATSSGGTRSSSGGVSAAGHEGDSGNTASQSGGASSGDGGTTSSSGGGKESAGGSGGQVTIPEPEVGTVGTECSPPGALQCADTHQRVIVVCGGEGTWEPFETCPVGQYCDTRPGETLGSCQDPHRDCVDQEPGYRFCQDGDVYACGPDALTTSRVEDCEYCSEGECLPEGDCPTENWINCSKDCTNAPDGCDNQVGPDGQQCPLYWGGMSGVEVIRIPAAADMCACENGIRSFPIQTGSDLPTRMRMTIDPPFLISASVGVGSPPLCDSLVGAQCCLVPSGRDLRIVIATDDLSARSANLHIEQWTGSEEEACP
ncbi:MAG: hypothetical protein JW940_12115 [Polyangiaceae bacterium]|nr:hypothetical protein [Polyangiaceae bacterium]